MFVLLQNRVKNFHWYLFTKMSPIPFFDQYIF